MKYAPFARPSPRPLVPSSGRGAGLKRAVFGAGLALLLVACGGGGGGSSIPEDAVLSQMRGTAQLREVAYAQGVTHHDHVVADSHPFSSMLCSVGAVDLAAYGYVEKEFFLSGKANVYDLDADERAVVRSTGHPYSTRLLVRYPSDAAKFSGRVVIDILNASSGVDLEDLWRRSWDHILKSGHAYIGITSKTDTANALKRFDAARYAELQWQVDGADENGLVWDMLSHLGTQLRKPGTGGLLGTLTPNWVYLGGQSQSGMYLNTYLSAFADRLAVARDGAKPLFDGYLNLVGPASVAIRSGGANPQKLYKATAVPQIAIMSEAEHKFSQLPASPGFPPFAAYVRPADSDSASSKFRLYEIAGAPHADPTSPIIPNNPEIAKANNGRERAPKLYTGAHVETQLNIDPFVNAALENLHQWAANGVAAPAAMGNWMRYSTAVDGNARTQYTPLRDPYGNALGGLRSPMIEAPLHRYYAFRNDSAFDTDGSMVPLDATLRAGLYPGGRNEYLARYDAAADALVAGRYLLADDAKTLKDWARAQSF